jgi:sec-independent protein translocase protein TatC
MALVPFPSQAQRRSEDDPDWDDGQLEETTEAGKMSFLDHLDELRKRIIWSVVAVLAGFLIACFFIQPIFDFIMKPLQAQLPPGGKMVYTEPSEAFVLYIKMAAIAGVMLASPVIMSQVWLFIAPGLYQHEKKFAVPFVVLSTFFFIAGAAFSHYVVFPLTWQFFVGFASDTLTFLPRIEPTFSMYLKMLLGMGLVFQMPTIVLFMARMGVLTARFLVKNFNYAVLIIFIVAAVVTPGQDPTSQIAMAGPMLVLYGISIVLAWMFGKKKRTADGVDTPDSE